MQEYGSNMARTCIRLSFMDRRLQVKEKEELKQWHTLHPRERILDLDLTLSYGIFEVYLDNEVTNYVEFSWDTTREASIFIKLGENLLYRTLFANIHPTF